MRVGMQIPQFKPSMPETMGNWFAELAQAAEENGFYSLWVMDHFFQLGNWLGEPETPMVEGYTTLGYLAGVTRKIKLGLLVGGVIYRHPSIVIKMISTLDVLSGGRMYMGIGAAWYEHETKSLGMRFPAIKERFEQLEDILQLAHHMWRGDTSEFKGKQFLVPYPVINPQPLTRPHPPILIGGQGERKTLRFVAQYADACNLFGRAGDEVLKHKLEVLRNHCRETNRPYEEIEKTVLESFDLPNQDLEAVLARLIELREIGFSQVIFNLKGDYKPEIIAEFGKKVVPMINDLA
jgi:F420-dependent oxidoreductase-like protein